jgi:hypothetical protein
MLRLCVNIGKILANRLGIHLARFNQKRQTKEIKMEATIEEPAIAFLKRDKLAGAALLRRKLTSCLPNLIYWKPQ